MGAAHSLSLLLSSPLPLPCSLMQLSELLTFTTPLSVTGPVDRDVASVRLDSRLVQSDDVFVAVRGERVDGRLFARGLQCACVVADGPVETVDGVTVVLVQDARAAVGPLAAACQGHPSREIPVIGVTGTNGKTTVSWMVEAMAEACGIPIGVVGTTGVRIRGQHQPSAFTTPEAPGLQAAFRSMVDRGCEAVVMEVSSIGLAMRRVDGTRFTVGAFTNLSRDHLDFHGTMEVYCQAKARLFRELLGADATAVLFDSPGAEAMRPARARGWTVGWGEHHIAGSSPHSAVTGISCRVRTPGGVGELRMGLVGRHNLDNALVAIGCGVALGWPLEACLQGLAALAAVPGRLERVTPGDHAFHVLVDYAHTPDALSTVLRELRPLVDGRIVTVFGCGGDRDGGKRAAMGEAASAGSDHVVITSDNPRSEDPDAILDDIVPGLSGSWERHPDRRMAIEAAIAGAGEGDLVLIAGKGHETTQTVGERVLDFDDRVVARAILEAP